MQMNYGREVLVSTMVNRTVKELFPYMGQLGVYLIVAGYDCKGPHLCQISAEGHVTYAPFLSMGSGSINAYSQLEKSYRDDMTIEEGMQLAIASISAGINYDLASGSNVDIAIMKKGQCIHYRNYVNVCKRVMDTIPYQFG